MEAGWREGERKTIRSLDHRDWP